MTREQVFELYLIFIESYYSKETFRYYESHLRCFYDYFKEEEITQKKLLNYITFSKNKGVSNKTINKRVLSAQRAYRYVEIECKPLENFKKLKEEDKRFDVLSTQEIETLKDYLKKPEISLENQVILRLLFDTGMRLGELLRICVLDIDFTERTIKLTHTKNHRDRLVIFRKSTSSLLSQYIEKRIEEGMILDEKTKLITLTKSGITSLFNRVKKKLGFKKFHPHMLRHTFATWLVQKEKSVDLIKNILGHSNYEMTKRYLHQNFSDVKEQLKTIDNDF